MNYSVVIPCAGMGKRMGLGYNKLLYMCHGKTIIEKTVDIFKQDPKCQQIILVISKDDEVLMNDMFKNVCKVELTFGGKERQDSVYQGLLKVKEDYVLIHDGARPFLKQASIDALLEALETNDACLLMVKAKDTLKKVVDGKVVTTLNRDEIMHAQTPQAFKTSLIKQAHETANLNNMLGTDDASLVESFTDQDVYVIEGDYDNIKITTIEDLQGFKCEQGVHEKK